MDWKERLNLDAPVLDIRLFDVAGTPVTVATLVIFGVILIVGYVASRLAQRAIQRALKFRGITDEGTVGVSRRLLHYLIMLIAMAIGLETVGINLSALFVSGAFLAIGVGFALQNILQNFVSGVILLFERSIKPGDVLRVDGQLVRVVNMGIRATVARTLDEEELIIPNTVIVQSTVTNYTLRDSLYRLRCSVGVVYAADMARVREVLEEVARSVPWRAREPEPVVLLAEFGSSAVVWEVSVWMDDPWNVRRRQSDLNERIWWALRDAEVTIAFPQVDVHLDPPVMESLARLRPAG